MSVVGARKCSDYSITVADSICSKLTQLGMVIVSGLAVGLDTAAHKACLKEGGRTVGILACGCLVNYPAENEQLKKKIIERDGALISELLPYSTTRAAYFQQRNRLISGISLGTLIIEASEQSGCLLTAKHVLEQGRDLFCITPHDIADERYMGVVPLLRDGAIPVYSCEDIVNEYIYGYKYNGAYANRLKNAVRNMQSRDEIDIPAKKVRAKITADGNKPAERAPAETAKAAEVSEKPENDEKMTIDESVFDSLEPNAAEILRFLAENPTNVDAIIDKTGIGYIDVTAALTDLEMFGYVTRNMDGTYQV
jgi:DNA processing protein